MLRLLREFNDRFDVEVHAFCLMGNHYHLLLRSCSGQLSDAMGWLGSQFTRRVNAERGVDGPIFRGRFHSVPVTRDEHVTWLVRYIYANPLDLGWKGPLASYPWSGLATQLGRTTPHGWLCTDDIADRFGNDSRRLELFVESARCRDAPRIRPDIDDAEIAAAVDVARAPGPFIFSDAHVRAAHTIVAAEAGLECSAISTVVDLDADPARAYIARVRRRKLTDTNVASLVDRVASVLAVDNGGHRVPGTR